MELTFFVIFVVLSLILIVIGLFRPEHTELSLIGFVFLFLLSFTLITGTIEYKTGVSNNWGCLCCGEYYDIANQENVFGAYNCTEGENSTLVVTSVSTVYSTFETEGVLAHLVGYWLAVMSFVGFLGVLIGLKPKEAF